MGWAIGIWSHYFTHSVLTRTYIPLFTTQGNKFVGRGLIIGFLVCLIQYLIFYKLIFMQEWKIDKKWESNVEALCPNIEPAKKFHTYTLNGIGINICIFSFPLGSYIARRILKTHTY